MPYPMRGDAQSARDCSRRKFLLVFVKAEPQPDHLRLLGLEQAKGYLERLPRVLSPEINLDLLEDFFVGLHQLKFPWICPSFMSPAGAAGNVDR